MKSQRYTCLNLQIWEDGFENLNLLIEEQKNQSLVLLGRAARLNHQDSWAETVLKRVDRAIPSIKNLADYELSELYWARRGVVDDIGTFCITSINNIEVRCDLNSSQRFALTYNLARFKTI